MVINVQRENEKSTLYLSGNIDFPGSETLKRYLSVILDNDSIKEVVLDFEEVGFIGSTGIGRLLLFYKTFSSKGGTVQIVNLNQEVSILFKTLKLDKLFNI
jgi:anti-anti-sigma factor